MGFLPIMRELRPTSTSSDTTVSVIVFSRLWGNWDCKVFRLFWIYLTRFLPIMRELRQKLSNGYPFFSNSFLPIMRELRPITLVGFFLFSLRVFSRLWGNWDTLALLHARVLKFCFLPIMRELRLMFSLITLCLDFWFSPDYEGIEMNFINRHRWM